MGVFQKIRENSLLSLILVGGSLFLFVIGDALTSGSFFFSDDVEDVVGKVEGKEIKLRDYNKMFNEIKYLTTNGNTAEISPREIENFHNQAWNQILLKNIIENEGKHLGVDVTDEEFENMIAGSNPYPFYVYRLFGGPQNFQQIREQLANNPNEFLKFTNNTPVDVAIMIKNFGIDLRKQEKVYEILSNSRHITKSLAKNEYEKNNTQASIQLLKVPYYLINDTTFTISDKEIEVYYKKNKHHYKNIIPSKNIAFAVFRAQASMEDEVELMEWANQSKELFLTETNDRLFLKQESELPYEPKFYGKGDEGVDKQLDTVLFKEEKGFVYGPYVKFRDGAKTYNVAKVMDKQSLSDSIKASHILLTPEKMIEALLAVSPQPSQEEVNQVWLNFRNQADSIYAALSENPSLFTTFVKQFSSDTASLPKNGSLDWVKLSDTRFPKQLIDSVFMHSGSGKIKKVSVSPSNGYFYYHIVRIDQEGPKSNKIQIGVVSRSLKPGGKTLDDYYAKASRLSMEVNKGAPFDVYRDSLGYYVDSANAQAHQFNLAGIENSRDLVMWAFNKNTKLNKSKVFELDGQYIVAMVKNVFDEDYLPVSHPSVKNSIKRALRDEVRFKKIQEILGVADEALFANAEAKLPGVSVQNYTGVGAPGVEGNTSEFALTGTILGLPQGVTSNWIKGNAGAYLVKVLDKTEGATNEDTDLSIEKENLASTAWQVQVLLNEVALKKAKVKDNRRIIQ